MTQASSELEKSVAIPHYRGVAKLFETFVQMLPVWFGIGFLGPVLAELYLRTPLQEALSLGLASADIYAVCMIFGGAYGVFAWRFGRWI